MSTNTAPNGAKMLECAKATTDYCCVYCMTPLRDSGRTELCCRGCGRSFPIISDIPILTSRPRELLMVHVQEFRQAQAALEKKRVLLSGSTKCNAVGSTTERIGRMLYGMTQNFGLIETFMKPIEDYLSRNKTQASNLIDWALAQNIGCVPQIMLPFFYQDWGRTTDYEDAESLIVGALMEHCPDSETVAILGAGACGITYASAKHFRIAYGLDLSVPTLLMAQAVMSGNAIEVYVAFADWQRVQLAPPKPAKNEIRLVAADIGTLPFAEESLSAIVTQYVMDIAGNPLGVAAEIQRVLKPGGVWVNFSNPFKIPGDPPELGPPEPSEMKELFEPLGLEIIKADRHRFTLLNLDKIYAWGHRNAQEVHFFIARRAARLNGIAVERRFQIWDRGDANFWWQRIPRIVPGREIQIIRKRVFGSSDTDDRIEIGLDSVSFSVSSEHTAFVQALFEQIDGRHTLREISNNLTSQGISMNEIQFRELIHCLLNQYCVISLDS